MNLAHPNARRHLNIEGYLFYMDNILDIYTSFSPTTKQHKLLIDYGTRTLETPRGYIAGVITSGFSYNGKDACLAAHLAALREWQKWKEVQA